MSGFALGLGLKRRLRATLKWAITTFSHAFSRAWSLLHQYFLCLIVCLCCKYSAVYNMSGRVHCRSETTWTQRLSTSYNTDASKCSFV